MRPRETVLRKNVSSVTLRARDVFGVYPGREQPAEFVTNSTS